MAKKINLILLTVLFCLFFSDYSKALEYYEKSLEIVREIGDSELEGKLLYNIGTIYNNLSDYSKSLEYYKKSLKLRW